MKYFLLLLLLLSSFNCNSIDMAKCILTNQITISITANVISSIKIKDWTKTVSTISSHIDKIVSIIIECNKKEEEKEKEEEKKKEMEEKCLEECKDLVDYHEKEECYKDCYFKYH